MKKPGSGLRWYICHHCFCPYPNQGMYEDHLLKFHSTKKKRGFRFQNQNSSRPKLSLSPSLSMVSSPSSSPPPSRNEINNSESDADDEVEMIMVPETPVKFKRELMSEDENEVVADSPIISSPDTSSTSSVGSASSVAHDFEHFESLGNKTSTPIAVPSPMDDVKPIKEQFEGLEKERKVNKSCKEFEEVIINYHKFRNSMGKFNYQCKIPNCLRILQSKVSTHQHWRIHSGEKPFKCQVCHRFFANITNMRRHYNVLHLGLRKNYAKSKGATTTGTATAAGVKVKKEAKEPQIKIETVINDDTWLIESSKINAIAQRVISKKYSKSKSK